MSKVYLVNVGANTSHTANARSHRKRASQSIHFHRGRLQPDNYLFVGSTTYSTQFSRAVDLQPDNDKGLLCKTIVSAKGIAFAAKGDRKWYSSLRSCRVVWDLGAPEERYRAELASSSILKQTGFELLNDL